MRAKTLLKGGHVVDPSQGLDEILDVLLADGIVASIGKGIPAPENAEIIDCSSLIVSPGLIDVHVHLREPGEEHKETIATGAQAAVAGGFTAICAMPDTIPVNDEASVTNYIRQQGERANLARVLPVGAATLGQRGETLADMGD